MPSAHRSSNSRPRTAPRPGLLACLAAMLLAIAALSGTAPLARAQGPAAQVTVRSDLTFLEAGRTEKLDLYLPADWKATDRRPAVVWIHGGGWTGGQKTATREKNVCRSFAGRGYVCISIDYRLGAGAWPQNLLDCKNGVRYLRAHAAELGVAPDRIAVAGGSAGGHLALMVGLTTGKAGLEPTAPYPGVSSAVRGIIDLYGIANILTRQTTEKDGTPTGRANLGGAAKVFGTTDPEAPVLKLGSPVNHVSPQSPPVLILHGRADATVDYQQSEELARVLQQHGVAHELVLLDGVGHTFDFNAWGKRKLLRSVEPEVFAFLAKHVGQP